MVDGYGGIYTLHDVVDGCVRCCGGLCGSVGESGGDFASYA